jgi:hypothetical protein
MKEVFKRGRGEAKVRCARFQHLHLEKLQTFHEGLCRECFDTCVKFFLERAQESNQHVFNFSGPVLGSCEATNGTLVVGETRESGMRGQIPREGQHIKCDVFTFVLPRCDEGKRLSAANSPWHVKMRGWDSLHVEAEAWPALLQPNSNHHDT